MYKKQKKFTAMTWNELLAGIEAMPEEARNKSVKLLGEDIYIDGLNLDSAERDVYYNYQHDIYFTIGSHVDPYDVLEDSEFICGKGDYFLTFE